MRLESNEQGVLMEAGRQGGRRGTDGLTAVARTRAFAWSEKRNHGEF